MKPTTKDIVNELVYLGESIESFLESNSNDGSYKDTITGLIYEAHRMNYKPQEERAFIYGAMSGIAIATSLVDIMAMSNEELIQKFDEMVKKKNS